MRAAKRPHKHKDPTNHDVWYLPYIGPRNQNVRSLCLCSLLGPYTKHIVGRILLGGGLQSQGQGPGRGLGPVSLGSESLGTRRGPSPIEESGLQEYIYIYMYMYMYICIYICISIYYGFSNLIPL